MLKPAFATPSLPLGTFQFVRCSGLTNSSRPAFVVARHRVARMMVEESAANGETTSNIPSDDGEMIVNSPISNSESEASEVTSDNTASTVVDKNPSAAESLTSQTSIEASSAEESFFSAQPDLMGVIDSDDDFDEEDIITPDPPGYWRNMVAIKEAQQKFKTHETDSGSPEFQIATLTTRIEYLTKHLKSNPKDFSSTRGLLRMVSTRRKLLKYLKRNDNERFNNIVSGLNIRISQKLRNL